MRGTRVLVALGGVALCLWAGHSRAACSNDMECKGDRICVDGACTDPAPGPRQVEPQTQTPAPRPAEPDVTRSSTSSPASNAAKQPIDYRPRNSGLMITGFVLTSAGATTLIATVVLSVMASNCNAELDSEYPDHMLPLSAYDQAQRCDRYGNAAGGLLIATVPLLATGLPFLLVGGKKVPVYARGASVSPWLTRDSGGLGLRLRF